jgi:DnaJ-class molecular chaperone
MPKCEKCKGSGWITKTGNSKMCDECGGSGKARVPAPVGMILKTKTATAEMPAAKA